MSTTSQRLQAVLLAGVMVLGVVAGTVAIAGTAAADVTSTDTSTTNGTSTTSEVSSGSTHNISTTDNTTGITIQVSATNDTVDPVAKLKPNASNASAIVNASAAEVASDTASGTYFNFTFSEAAMQTFDHEPGANVTFTVMFYNNSSDTTVDHEFNFYVEYSENTSAELVSDAEVGANGIASTKSENRTFFGFTLTEEDETTMTFDQAAADRVIITLSNESVKDDYEAAATDESSQDRVSSTGLFADKNVLLIETSSTTLYVPIFKSDAPSEWANATYAEQKTMAGRTVLVLHKGPALDGISTLTITSMGSVDWGEKAPGALFTGTQLPSDRPTSNGLLPMSLTAGLPMLFFGVRRRDTYDGADAATEIERRSQPATTGTPASPASPATPGADTDADAESAPVPGN